MQRSLSAVIKLLRRKFGRLKIRQEKDAVGLLVKTILSQNTSDVTSFRAFDNLKKGYKNWESLRRAPAAAIKRRIRFAGLSNIKAARIKYALDEIVRRRGSLELGFLRNSSTEKGYGFLRSIKGVGPKTAAIVLLFSFDKPLMPVDTHISRVMKRMGFVDGKAAREKVQNRLTDLTPAHAVKEFHLHLILHGREICTARAPKCTICNLRMMCAYFEENYGKQKPKNR